MPSWLVPTVFCVYSRLSNVFTGKIHTVRSPHRKNAAVVGVAQRTSTLALSHVSLSHNAREAQRHNAQPP